MKKIYTDNLRVEFNIVIDEINISPKTVINIPIIKDNTAIGIITEAELDDSKFYMG